MKELNPIKALCEKIKESLDVDGARKGLCLTKRTVLKSSLCELVKWGFSPLDAKDENERITTQLRKDLAFVMFSKRGGVIGRGADLLPIVGPEIPEEFPTDPRGFVFQAERLTGYEKTKSTRHVQVAIVNYSRTPDPMADFLLMLESSLKGKYLKKLPEDVRDAVLEGISRFKSNLQQDLKRNKPMAHITVCHNMPANKGTRWLKILQTARYNYETKEPYRKDVITKEMEPAVELLVKRYKHPEWQPELPKMFDGLTVDSMLGHFKSAGYMNGRFKADPKVLATPLSVKARKSRIRHASDSIDGTFLSTCIADYTDFVSFEKDAKVYIRELEKADDLGEASSGLFTEFITAVGDIWALLAPHEGKSAELFDKLLDKGHASWQKDAYGEKAPRAGEVCGNKPVEPEVVELMKPELSGPELLLHTTNLMIAEIECLQCAAKDAVILALENGSGIKIQKELSNTKWACDAALEEMYATVAWLNKYISVYKQVELDVSGKHSVTLAKCRDSVNCSVGR